MQVAKLINPLTLCEELAAAGYEYQAVGVVDGVLTGCLPDGTTERVSDAASAVLDAHTPLPLRTNPPSPVDRIAALEAAVLDLALGGA